MINVSRRGFMERAGLLAVAGTAAPFVLSLAAAGEAAAATAPDYKALVCIHLAGGNDYANTLVPADLARYAAYAQLRRSLALSANSLAATTLATADPAAALPGGQLYALAPGLAPLLPVWNAGRLAAVLNAGTLVQPVTKAQYAARSVALPPKLFSHNDQQSYWLAGDPEGANSGWGGRMGDLLQSGNGNAALTCINPSGSTVFLAGNKAVQYSMTSNGPVVLNDSQAAVFGSTAVGDALRSLLTTPSAHLIENEVTRVGRRALATAGQVTAALGDAPAITTPFPPGSTLAAQLRMVARMIATSADAGAKRQVFYVSLGSFDHHSGLIYAHGALIAELGAAMRAFYDATVELKIADRVTAFTASDFGRTLTSNGSGSDHGWGSMHFVMGGAVNGGRYYGAVPVIADDGPDDIGQGRLIPTTSVEQYAATLASWFGVGNADMSTVLPNIGNFNQRNLGFV
jgi:uncharacterized protein (DUF1501 family)